MTADRVVHRRDPTYPQGDDAPAAVRVRCTNPQVDLLTGKPCGWSGSRVGYAFERRDGTTGRTNPARKRCPRCGYRVELIREQDAHDWAGDERTRA
jgi:hypothetical protein